MLAQARSYWFYLRHKKKCLLQISLLFWKTSNILPAVFNTVFSFPLEPITIDMQNLPLSTLLNYDVVFVYVCLYLFVSPQISNSPVSHSLSLSLSWWWWKKIAPPQKWMTKMKQRRASLLVIFQSTAVRQKIGRTCQKNIEACYHHHQSRHPIQSSLSSSVKIVAIQMLIRTFYSVGKYFLLNTRSILKLPIFSRKETQKNPKLGSFSDGNRVCLANNQTPKYQS